MPALFDFLIAVPLGLLCLLALYTLWRDRLQVAIDLRSRDRSAYLALLAVLTAALATARLIHHGTL